LKKERTQYPSDCSGTHFSY